VHDPLGYNGTDAYAVDEALPNLIEDCKRKGIPEELYRHVLTMTRLCDDMKRQGIKVDREYVAQLEKEFQETKNNIFPSRTVRRVGKKGQELSTF
jgi:DNA polymerase I-like protein with 3'-5' exonuclease and polymerase domains